MPRGSLAALMAVALLVTGAALGLTRAGSSPSPAVSAPPPAAPFPPLLGIVGEERGRQLARIDPDTLRPRPGRRVNVGSGGCAPSSGGQACWSLPPWSFAPHRSLLAVASHEHGAVRSLRVVDVRRMRVAAEVRLGGGAVGQLAWLSPARVLMVEEICCEERQRLVAVDLVDRRVTARRPLGGSVQRVGRTPRELILLVSPAGEVGPARLAVADARGAVRSVRLDRIMAGVRLLPGTDYRVEKSIPGLAVDAGGRRAFVVSPALVAEVDLENLAVSYHEPTPSTSLLSRLLHLLDPPAYAKGASGPTRAAVWLGGGLLAVTGTDEDFVRDANGDRQNRIRAAGLSLIDTRSWSVRMIDRGATDVQVAGDVLLATGWSWDPATRNGDSIGLTAYGLDARKRFARFEGRDVMVRYVHSGRAYIDISLHRPPWSSLRVVDLDTGRATRAKRSRPLPWLLLERASGRWDG